MIYVSRFYGRLALTRDDHEDVTLQAIKRNMEGLDRISGERIWMELKKIVAGNYSFELLLRMLDLGMGKHIGLPEKPDIEEFKVVSERLNKLKLTVNPITRLTALLPKDKDVRKTLLLFTLDQFKYFTHTTLIVIL